MGISGCILVKNEEKNIENCIKNLSKIVDEIIVIDNGSTDRTVDIAKQLGTIVHTCSDKKFDMARNEYIKLASHEWIFVLDADERIDDTAKENVYRLLKEQKECVAFSVPKYEYIGEGRWALTNMWRLFRNNKQIRYTNTIMHASIYSSIRQMNGKCGIANFAIHHLDGLDGNNRMYEKRKRNIKLSLEDIENQKNNSYNLYYLYSFLGLEYAALGDYEKAEYIYKEAISIGTPSIPYAVIYLAQNYLLWGKYIEAQRIAQQLVNLQNTLQARAFLLLAEIELYYNNYNKVIEYCKQIEKIDCNNAANKLNMASLLINSNIQAAIDYVLSVKKINPYIMESVIYNKGSKMNVFAQQTAFLSCTQNAKEIVETLGEFNVTL